MFPVDAAPTWARTDAIDLTPDGSRGSAGTIAWDLSWDAFDQRTLYTFPRWAWQREVLPAAQVVPAPSLEVDGSVTVDGRELAWAGHGNVAHIYGHGNARRWGWLHAHLGADPGSGGTNDGGDVLELVTAVSMRPVLNRLPPITHLRLRIDGEDWPGLDGPSFGLRTTLGLPDWRVHGRIGRNKLSVTVHQPADRSVSIDYHDPDGATATCTNSERADVEIELDGPRFGRRRWSLAGTGHAEVGTRP